MDIARTVFAGRPRTVKTRSTLNAPMPVLIARVHNRGGFAASDFVECRQLQMAHVQTTGSSIMLPPRLLKTRGAGKSEGKGCVQI